MADLSSVIRPLGAPPWNPRKSKKNDEKVVQKMNICEKVKKNSEKVVQNMNICEKVKKEMARRWSRI